MRIFIVILLTILMTACSAWVPVKRSTTKTKQHCDSACKLKIEQCIINNPTDSGIELCLN